MQNKPVIVAANKAGHVINVSKKNEDYGFIKLTQDIIVVKDTFVDRKQRSALLTGRIEVLQSMNLSGGDEIQGKIIVLESLVPFARVNQERDLKIAGDTNICCSIGGEPIFRKTFYVTDENAKDEFIKHDNSDEIMTAKQDLLVMEKEAAIAANADFDNEGIIEENEELN